MHRLKFALITCGLVFAGCAATVQQPTGREARLDVPAQASKRLVLVVKGSAVAEASKDWEALRGEWRSAMSGAAAGKLAFAYEDRETRQLGEPATLVVVDVKDFRYLSPGARYGLGVMTGNAFMDADASFYAIPGRRLIGTRHYNTSSSAWQGIFAPMTAKQIEAISAEIVNEVAP